MRQILCLILTFSLLFCGCSSFQSEKVELSGSTEQTETSEEKPSESSTPQSDSPENDAQENTSREIFSDEQNPSKESPFLLCAYLPTSSAPDDLSPYAQNIALLDYLVLNTGVYWDENGELLVSDHFSSAVQALDGQTKLWCTINPQGELIRSQTAGSTIDTDAERQNLAQNIVEFAEEHKLSGIDIDWEFPLENEWEDFSAFLVTLKDLLDASDIDLSLALYPQDILLEQPAIDSIDRVHIMAYDQFDSEGLHSTIQTAKDSIDYFLSLGFSPEQLVLGIPAYGRPLDASAQWLLYSDIDLSAVSSEDPNRIGDFFFNTPQLAAEKAQYAKEQELGGVMIYHLLCDKTDEDSLIYAVSNAAFSTQETE